MANLRKYRLSNLTARAEQVLQRHVKSGSNLVVGLSGGIDSVVLLDVLYKLSEQKKFRLSALHINHQISRNAASWAEFCRSLCEKYRLRLNIAPVNINNRKSLGLEAAARAARYKIFQEQDTDFIVLAHHMDDQVETLLLQLLRGTGIRGAGAMPVLRESMSQTNCDRSPQFLRPFLDVTRNEILAYAMEHELDWIEDESNDDTAYDRNFLRREVLPIFEQRFPAYRKTLSRASRHFAEASYLLDELARIDFTAVKMGEYLIVSLLKPLDPLRLKNVFRYFLAQYHILMPSEVQLEQIIKQLLYASNDANPRIQVGDYELRRFRGQIYLQRRLVSAADVEVVWSGEESLKIDGLACELLFSKAPGAGISLGKLQDAKVAIRARRGGETMRPNCARPRRTVKNLLQEANIPPWQRNRLPFLFSNENLVWVAGIGIDCGYQAGKDEIGLCIDWLCH